jgi:N-methylhydantoinase B
MLSERLDPVAVEIHRCALQNIANEMGLTLVRTSGSPVVTEAMDFSTCLLDPEGEQLSIVAYVLKHSASSWIGTRTIIDHLRDQGVAPQPGDGWVLNDPYFGGAMHQGDIGVIMPQFYEGTHVGWSFSNCHVLDVGGASVSGFNPAARTVFDEGLRFPVTRMIREGRLEKEWERYIAANVRVPGPVLNDLRSMIAADNVAERKLVALLERVGIPRHQEYCRRNSELTEQVLRSRITGLPDGRYTSVDWSEFDGRGDDRLFEVRLTLEIKDDTMLFSFRGVPQVDAYMNSAVGAMHGAVMTAVMTTLGFGDLPFNGGMWKPLTIDIGPPGSIVNAVSPAPVSATHAETGLRAIKLVKDVLSQALSLSADPVLRARCAGQAQHGAGSIGVTGTNQHGSTSVVYYLDTAVGQGGGAQSAMDGQDSYGSTIMVGCGMADVELHEAADPVIFLWRRVLPNSGGPGRLRGGQGIDQAYLVAYADELVGWARTQCAEVPPRGVGGGFPGSASSVSPIRETNAFELMRRGAQPLEDSLTGTVEAIRTKQAPFTLRRGDVVRFLPGGGGGVGDPLLRSPDDVARDAADGYITLTHAEAVYGVVMDASGTPAADRTVARRAAIVKDRIARDPSRSLKPPPGPGVSVALSADGDEPAWACTSCGHTLCSSSESWRMSGPAVRETPIASFFEGFGMRVRKRRQSPEVVAREAFCPACGMCLHVDVTLAGAGATAGPMLHVADASACARARNAE